MELKLGYKQTDAGVIPEDWDVSSLRELVRQGPKNGYSGRRSKDTNGTPTLSLAATSNGRLVLNNTTVKYLEQRFPVDSPLFLEPGDVLVQRSNTAELVGTTAIFDGPKATFVYPDLMMRLRFKQRVTSEWFWRYANSGRGRSFFRSIAAGSTGSMPKISGEKLREMLVPVAPLLEQEAVALALNNADALIESLEQLIVKKRNLKQGAIQELLTGKMRLPGFETKLGCKQTEVGVIPKDWDLDSIENLAHIATGGRNTQDRVDDGQYPFFVRSQIVERINSYSYDGEAVLTAGDGVGTGKVFHYVTGKFDAHQRVYRISEFGERINGYFFYLYFSSHFYRRIMQMTAKSSVDSVRREMIAEMLVPFPPTRAEQEAIAEFVSDMDTEIATLEAKLAKARQIKQGMMQELLSGRIRLISTSERITSIQSGSGDNKKHNWQINEAVIIGVLANHFGSENFPLTRKRCTKLTYLLHRHAEQTAEGYLKKAAGPYNPATRYKGPEGIAQKNKYARVHNNGKYSGFVAADNINEAESYFQKWYGPEMLQWLDQFRFKKTDDLELIATVDMAMEDLRREEKPAEVATVKQVIQTHPEWAPKLEREIFSDRNITWAIEFCRTLFS
jgi:type I restriction enzyme S subunit